MLISRNLNETSCEVKGHKTKPTTTKWSVRFCKFNKARTRVYKEGGGGRIGARLTNLLFGKDAFTLAP